MNDTNIGYRKIGFHLTVGAFMAIGVMMLIGLIFGLVFQSTDDCDKSRWDRCGMKVATDNKTGKQYLLSPYGGIIERVAK